MHFWLKNTFYFQKIQYCKLNYIVGFTDSEQHLKSSSSQENVF